MVYIDTAVMVAALTPEASMPVVQAWLVSQASDSFTTLAVSAAHFRAAAGFPGQHALGLRAADALHLAIAADRGATLRALDRRMVEAGEALGIATLGL
jgi:predicted nucleic acid-binding protein